MDPLTAILLYIILGALALCLFVGVVFVGAVVLLMAGYRLMQDRLEWI